jgi:hypothetical protein
VDKQLCVSWTIAPYDDGCYARTATLDVCVVALVSLLFGVPNRKLITGM